MSNVLWYFAYQRSEINKKKALKNEDTLTLYLLYNFNSFKFTAINRRFGKWKISTTLSSNLGDPVKAKTAPIGTVTNIIMAITR